MRRACVRACVPVYRCVYTRGVHLYGGGRRGGGGSAGECVMPQVSLFISLIYTRLCSGCFTTLTKPGVGKVKKKTAPNSPLFLVSCGKVNLSFGKYAKSIPAPRTIRLLSKLYNQIWTPWIHVTGQCNLEQMALAAPIPYFAFGVQNSTSSAKRARPRIATELVSKCFQNITRTCV